MNDIPQERFNEDVVCCGTDVLSCHQFIRAIRIQAMESGKQADNRWMADRASVRFDGGALEWFENLDDETQTDWRLLRRAMLSRYSNKMHENILAPQTCAETSLSLPIFKGESEADCQNFVRQVRMRAFVQGKEGDSAWMARLAFPCFDAGALKWHSSLPMDIKSDWNRLEKAILLEYPRNPLLEVAPGRIRVAKWSSAVPPTPLLQEIRSHTDWLNQAKARQRKYREANNFSAPCWLLVQSGKEIPNNAIRTGANKEGKPLYCARAWYGGAGIVVGKCGKHLGGAHLPLNGKENCGITPFEVLVGDPSYFHWVAVPIESQDPQAVFHQPFVAVEAGFETVHRERATFASQVESESSWHPGKTHSGLPVAQVAYYGKEITRRDIRVLAWVE